MQRSPYISLEIIPVVFSVLSGSFLPLLQTVDPDIKQMDVQLLQDNKLLWKSNQTNNYGLLLKK